MAEYISKQAFKEKYLACGWLPEMSEEEFDAFSSADVAPVRHGRWIPEIRHTYVPVKYDEKGEPVLHEYTSYRCGLCGREEAVMEPYCHCGALMDGKEDEHDRHSSDPV